jgi:CDGSH-type Zn-finger protein
MAGSEDARITVTPNGPYHVTGSVPLVPRTIVTDDEGFSVEWGEGEPYTTEAAYDLCRCGESAMAPFCDKACETNGFDGTETASKKPYLEQADEEVGPRLTLTDAEDLCSYARFCDPGGQIWNLVQEDDDASTALAIREGKLCPSGRLVTWDKETRLPNELEDGPSIGVVQDPSEGCSGPLAVRGGIPVIGSDGFEYEVRTRQTLCRCGQSENKPFCNGAHAAVKFQDGQADRGVMRA